ncbi:MAG TPA: Fe-S cluster protein [Methanoculleus sp.]|nr:Fe-S cluster protein [Methanoculleus sp.]
MTADWQPPGKNCGACGAPSCAAFLRLLSEGRKEVKDCPFGPESQQGGPNEGAFGTGDLLHEAFYGTTDSVGRAFDFILEPLPGEPSARKIVLPFRPDIVEKWGITPGAIVTGRPMGAGCPVQHVLLVLEASEVTGLLTTHVVGPRFSRGREVFAIEAYHITGFEGYARPVRREPQFGRRMRFLPGFCMMYLGHTGVVNMVLRKGADIHIRVEDIRI